MISPFLKGHLGDLQNNLKAWLEHNFPDATSDQQLKGVMEELGELCHADLKTEQGIRGYSEENGTEEIKDAVGDIVIYLINYCNVKNISFQECLDVAHTDVMKRDWQKNKETGE